MNGPTQEAGSESGVTQARRDGRSFLHAVEMSLRWLEVNSKAIDRLNVFPVPDGDTGTNMVLTLRAAIDAADKVGGEHAGRVSGALSRGALMGARGNSGVILSQIIRGLAEGLKNLEDFGPREFAQALESAYEVAYKSVTKPVEGTILTVARDASSAAARVHGTSDNVEDMVAEVVSAARESVDNTPNQLPVLKEAGVVDAGGQGLYIILEGLLRYFRGEELPEVATEDRATEVFAAFAEAHQFDEQGYCTEFLIHGEDMDVERLRGEMAAVGGSLLVVGDDTLARVHVHTERPDEAIALALGYGQLDGVKMDNMDLQQAAAFETARGEAGVESPPAPASVLIAVAAGDGIEKVLQSLGASVVRGGQTMNPSAGDILEAVESGPESWAVILPNNSNIVMASRQAAEQSGKDVRVVPSRTMPQGISALLAFNPTADLDANFAAMAAACGQVTTIEVTQAIRDAEIGEVSVRKGQYIGLLDDEMAAGGDDPNALVLDLLGRVQEQSPEIVTLYVGRATPAARVDDLVRQIGSSFPDLEVETVAGGQELYDYIVSVE